MNTVSLVPSSESEISEVLIKETEPLHIAGGQSRLEATEEKIISTSALNGIVAVSYTHLTLPTNREV